MKKYFYRMDLLVVNSGLKEETIKRWISTKKLKAYYLGEKKEYYWHETKNGGTLKEREYVYISEDELVAIANSKGRYSKTDKKLIQDFVKVQRESRARCEDIKWLLSLHHDFIEQLKEHAKPLQKELGRITTRYLSYETMIEEL